MNNKEVTKQLVIIGNGFDLHFGQKTRFENYINSFSIDQNVIKDINEKFDSIVDSIESFEKEEINRKVNDIKRKVVKNLKLDNNQNIMLWDFYLKLMLNYTPIYDFLEIKGMLSNEDKGIQDLCVSIKKQLDDLHLEERISEDYRKNLSFWDLYFLLLQNKNRMIKDSNWCDVEKQILNFYCYKMIHSISMNHPSYEDTVYDVMCDSLEGKDIDENKFKNLGLIISTLNRENAVSEVGIDDYLYNELIKFSQNFIAYLSDNYDSQSEDIHGCNMQLFLDERVADGNKYELLDFNYTNFKMNNCINLIHIHGDKDLEDNLPIIGINADDLDSNERHAFKLTKQYQLISNENYKLEELDLTNINKIIFYGHSLALADYQYFKNIFDRVDLLKSSVKLIFKYSIFDPERKEEIQKDNYDSVYNLLKHYSDDTGVDVITTLILENRLKLQEI
ncbi:AbiH family protein [Ligilactobacillus aviarius]|uniref:AbiH family protein n=1 Tax=Ligilactobacillus aviarius TaxID=1606 RepID=UPI00242E35C1|nr:AbiH family protein [Ligilactobacillus aviarius]